MAKSSDSPATKPAAGAGHAAPIPVPPPPPVVIFPLSSPIVVTRSLGKSGPFDIEGDNLTDPAVEICASYRPSDNNKSGNVDQYIGSNHIHFEFDEKNPSLLQVRYVEVKIGFPNNKLGKKLRIGARVKADNSVISAQEGLTVTSD